jgi:hypothetical protein
MLAKTKMRALFIMVATAGLLLAGVALLGAPDPVQAHAEGKMQLAAVPAGAYQLTAWTSPEPARVGELHVATTVILAEDASPVLDAQVMVQLTLQEGGGSALSGLATTDDSTNKFLYEAIFYPAEDGLYRVSIHVTGADGAVGQAAFDLEILPAGGFNGLYLLPVGLGAAAIGLLWLARRTPTHPRLINGPRPTDNQSG